MLESFEYPTASGMVAELYAFSWHYADVVLRPDMLNLARLIIGEAQRLPDVGRAYQASGPEAIREHAERAALPLDEVLQVRGTVVVRPDPEAS